MRGVPEGYISLVRAFADFQTKRRPDPATPADFPPDFDHKASSKQQDDQLKEWYGMKSGGASYHDTPWGSWSDEVAEAHRLCRMEFLEAFAQEELELLYEVTGREKPRRVPRELFVKVLQRSNCENFLGLMFGLACEDEPPQCLQFLPENYEYLNGRLPILAEQEFDDWLELQQQVFEEEHSRLNDQQRRALENLKAIKAFLQKDHPMWPSSQSDMPVRKMAVVIAKHLDELGRSRRMLCKPYKESTVRGLFSNQNTLANRLADDGLIDGFWRN